MKSIKIISLLLILSVNGIAQGDFEKEYNEIVAQKNTLFKSIDFLSRSETIIVEFIDSA